MANPFQEFRQDVINTGNKIGNYFTTNFNAFRENVTNNLEKFGNTIIGGETEAVKNKEAIQDETNANLGTNIVENEKPLWQQQQEALWKREDEKQKHIEQREDTSVSRYVEDLRRSGVNPNIYNGGQAASGGGITNATQADYTMDIAEFNKSYELLMQEIELKFKGDQTEKDRIAGLIDSLIKGGALLGGAALKSNK